MIRLLRFLITGDWHLHQWEFVEKVRNFDRETDALPYSSEVMCRCSHCGVYKKFS